MVYKSSPMPRDFRRICDDGDRVTHLIAITGLDELTAYRVFVVDGWRWFLHTNELVQTFVTNPVVVGPHPVYGSVIDSLGHSLPDALVYVYPAGGTGLYPAASIANERGNYAIDLGTAAANNADWIVEGGVNIKQWNAQLVSGKAVTPLPLLEVSLYE
jgi:hypothetical protein